MEDKNTDTYSLDMINKFYENTFNMIKHVSWILIILNGTGAITLFSIDVSRYKYSICHFSCGFLSIVIFFVIACILMNPCCYAKNIRNIDKIMSIYKKFFVLSSFGMIFSLILLVIGANYTYNSIL